MMPQCLVVGGAGTVGRWIVQHLVARYDCTILDPADGPPLTGARHVVADAADAGDALFAGAELVLLCTSADAALRVIDRHAGRLAPGCTVIDLLSVKSGFASALLARRPDGPAAGINPMFRPQPGITGGIVLRSVYRAGGRVDEVSDMLARSGHDLRDFSADEHDRALAVVQCMTHAAVIGFGTALSGMGAPLPGLSTPPYRLLAGLLARVTSGSPHVYWEIQRHNVYAAAARRGLIAALGAMEDQVARDDLAGFSQSYLALQSAVSNDLAGAAADAQVIFASLVKSTQS